MRQIYITAEAFGQNIDLNYRSTEVEDPAIEPRELAAQYINPVCTRALLRAIPVCTSLEIMSCRKTGSPRHHASAKFSAVISGLHPMRTQLSS